jgi:hypothetical protein
MQREWIKLVEQNLGMRAASIFKSIVSNKQINGIKWNKLLNTSVLFIVEKVI